MTRNDLYTDGGEFRLPSGEIYIGPYHVHIDKGAMVGANHIARPHSRLTPINEGVAELIQIIQTQLRQMQNQESSQITSSISSSYSAPASSPASAPASAPASSPAPSSTPAPSSSSSSSSSSSGSSSSSSSSSSSGGSRSGYSY